MKSATWIFLVALGMFAIPLDAAEPAKRSFKSMQETLQPDKVVTYRKIGDRELTLHIFLSKGFDPAGKAPAFVAIHGGGWMSGDPRRFYPYAHALVDKGYVGISPSDTALRARRALRCSIA